MESVKVVMQRRVQAGKGFSRRFRSAGQVPAVMYGNGTTISITVAEKDLLSIQRSEAGENTILDVVIEGETLENCQAILREVQIHPIRRTPLHADFYRLDMSKTITVSVPLTFFNEPQSALQSANAVLTYLRRDIEVECLPGDIPDEIPVDLAHLHPGVTVKAGALAMPAGVTLVTDGEDVLVSAHIESASGASGGSADAPA